jgi:hypothetical protein
MALTKFTDSILEHMDKKQVTGVVYLDLKKAFDTVKPPSSDEKVEVSWCAWSNTILVSIISLEQVTANSYWEFLI